MKTKEFKENKGITLLILVITIIILLILAGITVNAITGNNGLIRNAGNAKEQSEIDNEKEIVDVSTVQVMGENKYGNITKSDLQNKLDDHTGQGKTEVLHDGKDTLYVYFIDTNRYYTVDMDGIVNGPVMADRSEDKHPGDITKDEDGNELSGDTKDDAYQINCIEDLCALSNSCNKGTTYQNKYIVLTKNLDFKSDLSYINGQIITEGNIPSCNSIEELKEILTTGEGFCPIGTYIDEYDYTFRGDFEGDYYTISNLYANRENKSGLFGACWGATIRNIVVKGELNVKNDLSKQIVQAGGISARGRNVTFINCVYYANIKGVNSARIGGISGVEYSDGSKFINCANYGTITGEFNAGGILCWDWSMHSKIYNCFNAGKVNVGIVIDNYSDNNTELVNVVNYGESNEMASKQISKIKNCFHLLQGTNSLTNEYITIYDEIKMKSEEFVNELNTFIETRGNESNIDTTGWAKWIYNENNFPTLDVKTTWNGTEWETIE